MIITHPIIASIAQVARIVQLNTIVGTAKGMSVNPKIMICLVEKKQINFGVVKIVYPDKYVI